MKLRERISEAVKTYFILVTLITVFLMVTGLLFDRGRTFSYEVFLSPLIYSAISVIPGLFLYSEKEVKMSGIIIRHILRIAIIEAVIMALVFTSKNIPSEKFSVCLSIAIGIAVIYALTILIEYLFELSQSKQMNKYLENYQKENLF